MSRPSIKLKGTSDVGLNVLTSRAEAGRSIYEGPAYAVYLRERVRAALSGEKPIIEKPKPINMVEPQRRARNTY